MIEKLRKLMSNRPVLVVIVYDEDTMTFSYPHPARVKRAVSKQGWAASPIARAKRLLKPRNDRVTVFTAVIPFHSELRDDEGREYILVRGRHFSFKSRLGRNDLNPKVDDLRARFGDLDGLYIEGMISRHFPHLIKQAA